MPTTPNFVWPYPQLSDPPDGPDQIGDLALAIDVTMKTVSDRVTTLEGGPFVRYTQTAAQTLANSTLTKITFGNAVTTHADVSVSGSNTFTLNRTGVWVVTAGVSYVSASGFRALVVANQADTARYAEESGNASATGLSLSAATTRRFTSGNQISIYGFQTSGGNLDTEPSTERIHISLAWLHA